MKLQENSSCSIHRSKREQTQSLAADQCGYLRGYTRKKKGFTYIELLITLAIFAVLFVPIMQLFTHVISSSAESQDLITAVNLAKWGMEKTKNLNLTTTQL